MNISSVTNGTNELQEAVSGFLGNMTGAMTNVGQNGATASVPFAEHLEEAHARRAEPVRPTPTKYPLYSAPQGASEASSAPEAPEQYHESEKNTTTSSTTKATDTAATQGDAVKAKAEAATSDVGTDNTDAAVREAARAAASAMAAMLDTRTAKPPVASGGTGITNSVDGLNPEFRAKLERVIDRMQEAGHTVDVVETNRSVGRQAQLYAQGRSTDGPVVTWTMHSHHLNGTAADLKIDGKWNNAEGYAALQRIAKEEGLHTLGSRDPGHLELAGDVEGIMADAGVGTAGVEAAKKSAMHGALAVDVRVASEQRGGIAQVAQVASVAPVAEVAQVASVARPGEGRVVQAPQAIPSVTASLGGKSAREGNMGNMGGGQGQGNGQGNNPGNLAQLAGMERVDVRVGGEDTLSGGRAVGRTGVGNFGSVSGGLNAGVREGVALGALGGAVGGIEGTEGVDIGARLDQLESVATAQDARRGTVNRLSMDVDGTTIDLKMRGADAGIGLGTSDSTLASRMAETLPELKSALAAKGIDARTIEVKGPVVVGVSSSATGSQLGGQNSGGNNAQGNGQTNSRGGEQTLAERREARDSKNERRQEQKGQQ